MSAGKGHKRPKAPIPEPIRGIEPDSWAEDTVARRMPEILGRTIEGNNYHAQVERSLTEMMDGMPDAPITELQDRGAPDASDWRGYIQPFRGMNWRQVPWFFAETYFYRRLLSEIGYFVPSSPHYMQDPFRAQKSEGIGESEGSIRQVASWANAAAANAEDRRGALQEILRMDLWGNRADLSNFPAGEGRSNAAPGSDLGIDHIILDDRSEALSYIDGGAPGLQTVDIVLDNVGVEMMADLALGDLLLGSGLAQEIRLRLKPHPMFVSDVCRADLEAGLRRLSQSPDAEQARFGERLWGHLEHSRMSVKSDFFWASPRSMWEMPAALREELAGAQLVILKGDLNYRRLLGDRHWPFTTPFDDIVCYFPSPLLAMRTLKAELACGLRESQIQWLEATDPDWLTDGDWGVIQFWGPGRGGHPPG